MGGLQAHFDYRTRRRWRGAKSISFGLDKHGNKKPGRSTPAYEIPL
jgi:hypothetical protein